ncbi:MAG: ankyrin repeat domain-containing protein [Sandaracinaceae bacterium]|nr:ankyrin repeat domain-containing protein [Sandaracinaceae bacterium]
MKFESEYATKLPESVTNALRRTNGGPFLPGAVLRVPDGSVSGSLYMLPIEQFGATTKSLVGLVSGTSVWARDGSGNAIVFVDEDHFFWDHNTDEMIPLGIGEDGFVSSMEVRKVQQDPRRQSLEDALTSGRHLIELVQDGTAGDIDKAVSFAIYHGYSDHVREVVERGIALSLERALHHASRAGEVGLIEYLVGAGADIDGRLRANTPLMSAASANQLESARLLVRLGANLSIVSSQGDTAARIARVTGNTKLAEFLEGAGGA